MQIICLITLIFMNGAYLFVSFNMESMIPDERDEQTESALVISTGGVDFDPADVLDLDIFDFDVEELGNSGQGSRGSISRSSRRSEDGARKWVL
jgi:hypothetical protein